jgi:hypothetical protein
MSRYTELADEKDVEGRVERLRDLEPDGYAAARQREHDDIVAAGVRDEPPGQPASGVAAVEEAIDGAEVYTRPGRA